MPSSILTYKNVTLSYYDSAILKDINIEIQQGELIYLTGSVGAGKTSFFKSIIAELPISGTSEVLGYKLEKMAQKDRPFLRRKIGVVFQDYKLLIDRSVHANLKFVLEATGWNKKADIDNRINTVLTKVGLIEKAKSMPYQLSGGEQQRVVVARAMLNDPMLILADEPTGNIDQENTDRIMNILLDYQKNGRTAIIATHDKGIIEKYPGRVLTIQGQTIVELNHLQ